MAFLKFLASGLFFVMGTSITFCMMSPFILLKLLPIQPLRTFCARVLVALAHNWSVCNEWWIDFLNPVRWNIRLPEDLSMRGWYLLVSNHQSWVDILVLQKAFNGRIPFLKFFIKHELLYVPLLGIVWWALDYPFMRRRGGASVRKDLQAARKACEKFRHMPTSVISFVEGTRFTAEKHRAQQSPYLHLLQPKAGGISVALETMGDMFTNVLDVTIAYPKGVPTFFDLMAGRLKGVSVTVRTLPVPADLLPQKGQSVQRAQVQKWIHALWQEKDAELTRLLGR